MRGLSEAYGSWNTICSRRRRALRSRLLEVGDRPRPSNRTSPAVGSMQPQEQPAEGRLAAARLAHQAEGLAALDAVSDTPLTAWTIGPGRRRRRGPGTPSPRRSTSSSGAPRRLGVGDVALDRRSSGRLVGSLAGHGVDATSSPGRQRLGAVARRRLRDRGPSRRSGIVGHAAAPARCAHAAARVEGAARRRVQHRRRLAAGSGRAARRRLAVEAGQRLQQADRCRGGRRRRRSRR